VNGFWIALAINQSGSGETSTIGQCPGSQLIWPLGANAMAEHMKEAMVCNGKHNRVNAMASTLESARVGAMRQHARSECDGKAPF
jgi:hypothetical protein